jgi:elongation factor P hydroxylase
MSVTLAATDSETDCLTCDQIITIFDRCFAQHPRPAIRARLIRGGDEPQYRPPTRWRPWGEIIFARGLAASSLHEAAHWLRAGPARRLLPDFGYWYIPDGRDDAAQARFEQSEIGIQAIEWILAWCAGVRFHVSADNLRSPEPSSAFCAAIATDIQRRLAHPLPYRQRRLCAALTQATGRTLPTVRDATLAWSEGHTKVRA